MTRHLVGVSIRTFVIISAFFCLQLHAADVSEARSLNEEREDAFFTRAGDVLQYAMPASALCYSLAIRDTDGAKEWLWTVGSAVAVTYTLKFAVGRPRPFQEADERGTSFPSGHTTLAFVGAAYWQRRYGWGAGVPAYALAAAIGYSRVWGRWHYWSDVAAGAAIGTAAGYIFTKPYEKIQVDAGASASGGHLNLMIKF